jgi:hypothetical protein
MAGALSSDIVEASHRPARSPHRWCKCRNYERQILSPPLQSRQTHYRVPVDELVVPPVVPVVCADAAPFMTAAVKPTQRIRLSNFIGNSGRIGRSSLSCGTLSADFTPQKSERTIRKCFAVIQFSVFSKELYRSGWCFAKTTLTRPARTSSLSCSLASIANV